MLLMILIFLLSFEILFLHILAFYPGHVVAAFLRRMNIRHRGHLLFLSSNLNKHFIEQQLRKQIINLFCRFSGIDDHTKFDIAFLPVVGKISRCDQRLLLIHTNHFGMQRGHFVILLRIVVDSQEFTPVPAEAIKRILALNVIDEEFNKNPFLALPDDAVCQVTEIIRE